MTRWERLKQVLGAVLELPADERRAFLDAHCNAELRHEVEAILDAHQDEGFLEQPVIGDDSLLPAERVGPYRLLGRLGSGGMGDVFLAEQEEPIRRRVALKLMRPGAFGGAAAARFEIERQALARMQHPNIARVFDAGAVEIDSILGGPTDRRSFFVMELISGRAITRYCDDEALSLEQRLELFVQVCRGVQHAHQRGIIHRDLKPSNVLVLEEDGRPVPKIIDFGVAKAVETVEAGASAQGLTAAGALTDSGALTGAGQWIGTPEYMSPEQADAGGSAVDTRADVYALGALLYELLTGWQPFDPEELRGGDLRHLREVLRTHEPVAPSRRVDPGSERARRLRGDLDAIVSKALEKEPERRFASVVELAADIQRHLHHEVVSAVQPSRGYRLSKFVRRHRTGVATAVAVVLALGFGLAAAMVGMVRTRDAEAEALVQAALAEEKAATAEQVTLFLFDLFEAANPSRAPRPELTLREVLDRGAERVRVKLADQPEARGQLLFTIGRSYKELGLFDQAREMLEESVAVRRGCFGDDHLMVAESLHVLSAVYIDLALFETARSTAREALEIRRRHLGSEHLHIAGTLNNLAVIHKRLGDLTEARQDLERALTIYESQGASAAQRAQALDNLGLLLAESGQPALARPHLQRALALLEAEFGVDSGRLSGTLNNLALVAAELGDHAAARDEWRRVLDIDRRTYGDEHPYIAFGHFNLGKLAEEMGQCEIAEEHLRAAVEILRQRLPSEHPRLREATDYLASLSAGCEAGF